MPRHSTEVSSSMSSDTNDAGTPVTNNWSINCTVHLQSFLQDPVLRQRDFSQQEAIIFAGLSGQRLPFALLCDDGSLSSVSLPINANLLDGPSMNNWSTNFMPSEFAGQRTVKFTISAKYRCVGTAGLLFSFNETVSFTGTGGPEVRIRRCIDGSPVPQQIFQATECYATQSGQAVGVGFTPNIKTVARPIWPPLVIHPAVSVSESSPERLGNTYQRFPVTWNYSFQSPVPFSGRPNRWV